MQSPVTGEHTCMALKPINNDDIEVTGSSKCGFLEPFYQGIFWFYFMSGPFQYYLISIDNYSNGHYFL